MSFSGPFEKASTRLLSLYVCFDFVGLEILSENTSHLNSDSERRK